MAETQPTPPAADQPPPPAGPLRRFWRNWIKPIGLAILIVFGFRSTFYDWNDVPSASMEPTILVGDRIFVNKLAYDLKVPFSSLLGTPWRIASWGGPERGDVVVFFAPPRWHDSETGAWYASRDDAPEEAQPRLIHDRGGRRMVKRVIGLPGDKVEVRNNVLYVNDQRIENQETNEGKYSRLDLDPPRNRDGTPVMAELPADSADFSAEALGDVLHPVMYLRTQRPSFATWGPQTIPDDQYLMMGDNRNNSRDSRDPSLGFIPRERIVGKAFGVAFSLDRVPSFRFRWERFFRGLDHEEIE